MSEIFHYCGHIISDNKFGRFPQSNEKNIQLTIENYFSDKKIKSCYGSLASGADLMLAEAMFKRGARLHVILPFEKKEFVKTSVAPSGYQWEQRFSSIIQQADSITQIFSMKPKDENLSYALCTEIALGLSLLEFHINKNIDTSYPKQVTIWDRQITHSIAGTYPDMQRAQFLKIEIDFIPSQAPFEVTSFKKKNATQIQPINICIYDKKVVKNITKFESIDKLIAYLNKNGLSPEQSIDLDRDIFGAQEQNKNDLISTRALGHIIFHCFAKEKLHGRDSFISSLIEVKKLQLAERNRT